MHVKALITCQCPGSNGWDMKVEKRKNDAPPFILLPEFHKFGEWALFHKIPGFFDYICALKDHSICFTENRTETKLDW